MKKIDLSALLTSSPEVRNGRPCVTGTQTTVHRIATWYKAGESPEAIACEYPQLPLAGVYAALAYYHANQSLIERELAQDARLERALENDWLNLSTARVA